jgi:hypothetical protein
VHPARQTVAIAITMDEHHRSRHDRERSRLPQDFGSRVEALRDILSKNPFHEEKCKLGTSVIA